MKAAQRWATGRPATGCSAGHAGPIVVADVDQPAVGQIAPAYDRSLHTPDNWTLDRELPGVCPSKSWQISSGLSTLGWSAPVYRQGRLGMPVRNWAAL